MTHSAFEQSSQDGDLVWLLEVTIGGAVHRYNSLGRDYSAAGETWLSGKGLSFGDINQSDKAKEQQFKVTAPFGHPLVNAIKGYIAVRVTMRLLSIYASDPDQEIATEFLGADANLTNYGKKFEIIFYDILGANRRQGLTKTHSQKCNHAVYQKGCNLDRANFAVAANITGINGKILTVPEAALVADNEYSYGYIDIGGNEFYIESHTGDQIKLQTIDPAITLQAATLYPGCDNTESRCVALGNTENNGGMWLMSSEHPFDGSSIY